MVSRAHQWLEPPQLRSCVCRSARHTLIAATQEMYCESIFGIASSSKSSRADVNKVRRSPRTSLRRKCAAPNLSQKTVSFDATANSVAGIILTHRTQSMSQQKTWKDFISILWPWQTHKVERSHLVFPSAAQTRTYAKQLLTLFLSLPRFEQIKGTKWRETWRELGVLPWPRFWVIVLSVRFTNLHER